MRAPDSQITTRRYVSVLSLFLIMLLVGACNEKEVEPQSGIENNEEQSLSDWEALFADVPDPKTLPDELKADQEVPTRFDLIDIQSPVKSQGSRGVCSIFSTVALMEHLYIKRGAENPDFSEQFLQWSVKAELGRFVNTSGSNGSANLTAINRFGIVEERVSPYQSSPWGAYNDERCSDKDEEEKRPMVCFTNGEPAEEVKNAERFKLPQSRWVSSDARNIKSFIHENGTGIIVGMTFFYQSWNHRKSQLPVNSEYSRQGYVLYPNEKDKELSLEKRAGHSILIIGWDDELEVPMVDEEGKPMLNEAGEPMVERGFFLFKNSWGTSNFGTANQFGAGYGWLSMRYVEEYGSAVSARPPEESLAERCDDGLDNDFDGLTDCEDSACGEAVVCQVAPQPELSFDVQSSEAVELVDREETISVLTLTNAGNLEQLILTLDITHTFTGDLQIDLESPSGQRVNVMPSDRESNLGELKLNVEVEGMRGEWAAGEWKLIIKDMFAEDSGVLNHWSLSGLISTVDQSEVTRYESTDRLSIPDNDARGVSSKLSVSVPGSISSASIWLRISHAYRGDLSARLQHPSGAVVTLFDREGRNETNVDFKVALPEFIGLQAEGEWTLVVSDLGQGDVGQLEEWGLELVTPQAD